MESASEKEGEEPLPPHFDSPPTEMVPFVFTGLFENNRISLRQDELSTGSSPRVGLWVMTEVRVVGRETQGNK